MVRLTPSVGERICGPDAAAGALLSKATVQTCKQCPIGVGKC